ncbi:Aspartate aminotransferase [Oopsacas minuta]|uniref:Aspartate aminotransferase, mitochondrial n=1 Tax=Oopsacas minuta TaxID=111878 RepID=A0AAV7JMQ1_9METZ|nr:Aspartate aminotransferase [Oopsacas minuta]
MVTKSLLRPFLRPTQYTLQRNTTPIRYFWSGVEMGPPDNIFGLVEAFKNSTHPNKVNLAMGAYRDEYGNPYVLNCIKKAEKIILDRNLDKEYAGMSGFADFCADAAKLTFGEDSPGLSDGRIATVQSISGTGSLYLASTFFAKFYPHKVVYHSNQTWGNHAQVFKSAGLEANTYTYYDKSTCGLNADGMLKDLRELPSGSIILLHASAHNPTGVDPTQQQWRDIGKVLKEKGHLPFIDMAYQGFATGDLDRDAFAVRLLEREGLQPVVTQSCAKNLGLYGERTGALHVVTASKEEKDRVMSQIKILIRPTYSNPPIHGARLAVEVWRNKDLYKEWLAELKIMSGRISDMRKALQLGLETNTNRKWPHITRQIGMFCYSGLETDQVTLLREEHAIFMTKDGRISMVSLSNNNIEYVVNCISKLLIMSEETPKKRLKFDEDTSPLREDLAGALCTKIILGEDIRDLFPKFLLLIHDFIANATADVTNLIQTTVTDDEYVEKCKKQCIEGSIEMLAYESPRIQNIIEDISCKLLIAKNDLCSDNIEYKQALKNIDKDIQDNLVKFEGLVTAKKLLEGKEDELHEIRKNLELCKEFQLKFNTDNNAN